MELKDNITITLYSEENGNGLPKDLEKDVSGSKREHGCDTCYEKLTKRQGGSEHFYIMKRPYGEVVNPRRPAVWACTDCYPTKEQEYLQKYSGILERYLDKDGDIDYRWIKNDSSYDMKESDQNGEDNKVVVSWLLRYFQVHKIKKITFENDKLVITYNNNNNNEIISRENITSELQTVKSFSQRINKKEVSLEELKNIINTDHHSTEKPKDNTLLISCGIGGILIFGVVIGLLINKKRHKNK